MRALAITSKKRSPLMPELPTVDEAGVPGYEYQTWFGLWAPKGTPQPIVEKLNAEVTEGARRSWRPAAHRRDRGRAVLHGAEGHRAVHEGGDRQMGRGGQARRDKGRISGRLPISPFVMAGFVLTNSRPGPAQSSDDGLLARADNP